MLHTETVSPATLELLVRLMNDERLNSLLSLNEMIDAYVLKYKANSIIPLKAIVYWDDINFAEPIKMLDESAFKWRKIEKRLLEMQRSPQKVFAAM